MQARALKGANALLALAVSCVVLVSALYLVFVCTSRGQRIDDAPIRGRLFLQTEAVENADQFLRGITISSVALVGGAIMLVALARSGPRLAIACGVVIGGANVTTQLIKDVLPRPDLLPGPDFVGGANIYPSGHTTVAMSLAMAAILAASPRTRGFVAVVATIYAASIGVATLTAGWHRPSDAIGAFAVVTAWASAAAWWDRRDTAPPGPAGRASSRVATPALAVLGAVLALGAFVVLAFVLVARRIDRLDAVPLNAPYRAAVTAVAAAAFVLVGALLFALREAATRPAPETSYAEP